MKIGNTGWRAARLPLLLNPRQRKAWKMLSLEEDAQLHTLARSVVVKGVESPERLLDETALFLHRVVANLPAEKQQMLDRLHRSDDALAGKKVLVVDDDVRNIFALSSVLERRGMTVLTAGTGREAVATLEAIPGLAIVLMDIMMPEMDGYETMQVIRQNPSFRRLPIIALTAKAMKGDREKCLEAGASDYLAKPVNTEQLLSELRQRAEELQRLNDELARSNQERQVLLERERAARAEAEVAVRLREQFIAIASHELKTPLTALIGYGQIFQLRAQRAGNLSERDAQNLERLLAQADRLDRMINALLDVSRIEQGRLRLECRTLDMTALTRHIVAEIQTMNSQQLFDVQSPEGSLWIAGDPLRLEQVLYN